MSIELNVSFKEEEGITREFHIYIYNSKAYMLQPSWNSRITNGDASDGGDKKEDKQCSEPLQCREEKTNLMLKYNKVYLDWSCSKYF